MIVNLPRRPRSWEAASCKPLLLPPSSAHACPSQRHRAGLGWKRGAACRRAERLTRHLDVVISSRARAHLGKITEPTALLLIRFPER